MNLKTKRYLFYILPPFLYAGIIFLLSSISHYPEVLPRVFCFDKVIHFIEYYIFGCLTMRAFVDSSVTVLSRHTIVLTIFVGIFYGIGDEWHQSFVPGRFATVYDVIFDSLGVVLAAFTYRFAVQRLYIMRVIENRIDRL